jgi:hypothetical protein
MPIIHSRLDGQGQAFVEVVLLPSGPRVQALQTAGQPLPSTTVRQGLIDTGATVTIIDPSVRKALGLVPYRIRPLSVPGTAVLVNAFWYKLDLLIVGPQPPSAHLHVPTLSVVETPISHSGADILVGCDVLSHCFFGYSGTAGDFILAF